MQCFQKPRGETPLGPGAAARAAVAGCPSAGAPFWISARAASRLIAGVVLGREEVRHVLGVAQRLAQLPDAVLVGEHRGLEAGHLRDDF